MFLQYLFKEKDPVLLLEINFHTLYNKGLRDPEKLFQTKFLK